MAGLNLTGTANEPGGKKQVCEFWLRGNCNRKNCKYAHIGAAADGVTESEQEDEADANVGSASIDCKFWMNGHCKKGGSCNMKHDAKKKDSTKKTKGSAEPCRDFANGKCARGNQCKYAHDRDSSPPCGQVDPKGSDQKHSLAPCGFYGWPNGPQEAPKGPAKDPKVTKMTPAGSKMTPTGSK